MPESVVIVGASLGGLRAAELLRRKGYAGPLTLLGEEPHLPYDRPPLSKQLLAGTFTEEQLALRRKPYDELDLDLRLGTRAAGLDTARRRVLLADGSELPYDAAILATGARARRLPDQPELRGLFTLRTLDDARALREALASTPRVCVVGAGFIGAEVASTARALGCEVTILEALSAPLVRGLGVTLGAALGARMQAHGATLRCGVSVAGFDARGQGDGRQLSGVRLSDRTLVPAEVCIVGIGAVPNTEWLAGSGLTLDDGVVTDAHCHAGHGVYAVGDVARFWNPLFGEHMRLEHWSNAVEGARAAVDHLLHGDAAAEYAHVPSFWSDQFGVKLQGAGRPLGTDEVRFVAGSADAEKFCAVFGREGKLSAVLAASMPPLVIQYQKLLAAGASWEAALAAAPPQN
ncbi:MAG: FAD-dependent oxidoreductase [Sandaracinaceae bacterium]|nr:FAD-dependent oxidoreductase [Sandaracinaceae bacterium]